jgi:hypothetical protein
MVDPSVARWFGKVQGGRGVVRLAGNRADLCLVEKGDGITRTSTEVAIAICYIIPALMSFIQIRAELLARTALLLLSEPLPVADPMPYHYWFTQAIVKF